MNLKTQKRIASDVLKCGIERVKFDPAQTDKIKEAITKNDIRSLVNKHAIIKKQKIGVSRVRANEIRIKRTQGSRRGASTKRGKATARTPAKRSWMNLIRKIREFLQNMKESKTIDPVIYKELYRKSKGGYFRSLRHIKLYMEEHNMFGKK